jgi:hypothetical protein
VYGSKEMGVSGEVKRGDSDILFLNLGTECMNVLTL